jgi:hypothetical protein
MDAETSDPLQSVPILVAENIIRFAFTRTIEYKLITDEGEYILRDDVYELNVKLLKNLRLICTSFTYLLNFNKLLKNKLQFFRQQYSCILTRELVFDYRLSAFPLEEKYYFKKYFYPLFGKSIFVEYILPNNEELDKMKSKKHKVRDVRVYEGYKLLSATPQISHNYEINTIIKLLQ